MKCYTSELVGKTYLMKSTSGSYNYQVHVLDEKQVEISQFNPGNSSGTIEAVTADYTLVNGNLSYSARFSTVQISMTITLGGYGEAKSGTIVEGNNPAEPVEANNPSGNSGGGSGSSGETTTTGTSTGDGSSSSSCPAAYTSKEEIRALIQGFDYIDHENGTREYGVTKPEAVAALKAGCNRSSSDLNAFMEGFLCEIEADISFKNDVDVQNDVDDLEHIETSKLPASCEEIESL